MSLTSYDRGLEGERVALALLKLKGYTIIATRYKTPQGEIDIIASINNILVCVEVKTRQTATQGMWAVLPRQQARILNAYLCFCQKFKKYDTYMARFDVVICVPGKKPLHIEQAFESVQ